MLEVMVVFQIFGSATSIGVFPILVVDHSVLNDSISKLQLVEGLYNLKKKVETVMLFHCFRIGASIGAFQFLRLI